MAYTEKTTTGYGTRVGNSLKAVLVGFVLIIGALLGLESCLGIRILQSFENKRILKEI